MYIYVCKSRTTKLLCSIYVAWALGRLAVSPQEVCITLLYPTERHPSTGLHLTLDLYQFTSMNGG